VIYTDRKLNGFVLVTVKESAESVRVPIPQEGSNAMGSGQSGIPSVFVKTSSVDNCNRPAIDKKFQVWKGIDVQEGEVIVRWLCLLTTELLLVLVLLAEELVLLPVGLLTVP